VEKNVKNGFRLRAGVLLHMMLQELERVIAGLKSRHCAEACITLREAFHVFETALSFPPHIFIDSHK